MFDYLDGLPYMFHTKFISFSLVCLVSCSLHYIKVMLCVDIIIVNVSLIWFTFPASVCYKYMFCAKFNLLS